MCFKKVISAILCAVFALSISMFPAHAVESKTSTDVHLTVEPSGTVPGLIDVTVPDCILLSADAGCTDLTADKNFDVINNADVGGVQLARITAFAVPEWELVSPETDFTSMMANTKKLAILGDGHDLSGTGFAKNVMIAPGGKDTTVITGKTSVVTAAITDQPVANLVATFCLSAE